MADNNSALNISLAEAAVMLNLSVRSLNYLRSDKRLKTRKQGKRVLVPMSEVHRLSRMDLGTIRPAA
jgi:hypothetical protein